MSSSYIFYASTDYHRDVNDTGPHQYHSLDPKDAGELRKGNLDQIRAHLVLNLLQMFKTANAGHIGSCLSCVEILILIFFKRIKEEDQFLLSKGHAACALYNILAMSSRLDPKQLNTFYKEGTLLAAHPPCQAGQGQIPAIRFGTGSLGHGLSLSTGMALADRLKNQNDKQHFCLLSDGECNEGSVWEAAIFAAHHKLKNLWVVIDANGLQGFGKSSEVLKIDLESTWKSMGFETIIAENGNDFKCLERAFETLQNAKTEKPKCIIAQTTKGHGISFMANKLEWHYLPMKEPEFELAMQQTQQRLDSAMASKASSNKAIKQ